MTTIDQESYYEEFMNKINLYQDHDCSNILKCVINAYIIPWKYTTPIESISIQKEIIIILNKLYTEKKITDFQNNSSLFFGTCETGNILLAQWLYSKYKTHIDFNLINRHNNQFNFLYNIIVNENIEVLYWLSQLKEIYFSPVVLNRGLLVTCSNNQPLFFKWILNKLLKKQKHNQILSLSLVNIIKEKNCLEIAIILSEIMHEYYIKIIDNRIISSRIINESDKKVMNHHHYTINEKFDNCEICFENPEHYIKLECKHAYCRDCYLELQKCPMCLRIINKKEIKLIKNII